jgi:pimeloyl-ACP methyl ester carboxylesterase
MQPRRQLQEVQTDDGARLLVALAGHLDNPRGPWALLQHGFPDSPATWRQLTPALVAAGYRVATPWLRGYRPSTTGRSRPTIDRLGADLRAVHDALGGDGRAVLIGHDWGAAASWSAACGTDRWRAVIGLGVPPEPVLAGMLLRPRQLWRSRYMLQAQLPGVQRLAATGELAPLVRLWRRWSPGYEPDADDLAGLRAALPDAAAVADALALYRAQLVGGLLGRIPRPDGPVPAVPMLYLHGDRDGCIDPAYATAAAEVLLAADARSVVRVVAGAGHFLQLQQPATVAELVVGFLAATADSDI